MKVKKNSLVRIHYGIWLDDGEELDISSDELPLEFICGRGDVVPGLERELIGMEPGQRKRFQLPPEDAYGVHEPELVKDLPLAGFPSDRELEQGERFSYRSKHGVELCYRVVEVGDETIRADFNHPMAGRTLDCEVEVVDVLDETADFQER